MVRVQLQPGARERLKSCGLTCEALGWKEQDHELALAVTTLGDLESALQRQPPGILVLLSSEELTAACDKCAQVLSVPCFEPLDAADLRRRAIWLQARVDHAVRGKAVSIDPEVHPLVLAGRLSASTSHEIRNALAFTQTNLHYIVDSLKKNPSVDAEVLPAAVEAMEGIGRALDAARTVMELARQPTRTARPTNVVEVIERVVRLIMGHAPKVYLEKRLTQMPPALADSAGLAQVLTNLMFNGIQAAGAGGRLLISTSANDDWVIIAVADNGPGIPPDLASRLFEPFASGKPGAGTGLGLSISQKIAASYGGKIETRPGPLGGAEFRVLLRRSHETGN